MALALSPIAAPFTAPLLAQERIEVGDLGRVHGDPEAPLQVVEFTDPSCPFCAQFHAGVRDSLFRAYVDTGLASWTTVPYVNGQYRHSQLAARAVECADREEMMDPLLTSLFDQRERWVDGSAALAREVVTELATGVGMDVERLDSCLASEAVADRVEQSRLLGVRSGVRGTPTYFIDGFPAMGAVPYSYVKRIFDRRLAEIR